MAFCTSCGKPLEKDQKFCVYCGAHVDSTQGSQPSQSDVPASAQPSAVPPVPSPPPLQAAPAGPEPAQPKKPAPTKYIIAAVGILIVLAAAYVFVLPKIGGLSGVGLPAQTPVVTTAPVTSAPTPTVQVTTAPPTPEPDPFPDAKSLKEWFFYNEGKYASKATVYRTWIADSYTWHNQADNKWYPQKPGPGNKYLFVYAVIVNLGTDAYPYPKSSKIYVHYGGKVYTVDSSHRTPDKTGDAKATGTLIQEIMQQSDYFNNELVEDYGYSHGAHADFVYPGQGNAIDGYLIYEVPQSLTPDKTYVEIIFDGDDRDVWKLA